MAPRAVLIAGPTASGKSALALELAERTGGVVINADSMQVYADLRIITARPTPEEEARAPHRLYGHVDGIADYSSARWAQEAAEVLAQTRAEGRLPILVGGTGLYFKALTEGLSAVPPIPAEVREKVRGLDLPAPELHALLASRDPETAARLRPSDTQRLLRALEVFEATGRGLSWWQAETASTPLLDDSEALKLFLAVDREASRARIERRFHAMLEQGALDEVRALLARNLPADRPVLKAHGVPWIARHLAGEIGLEEAAQGGIHDTRRYAKRQDTWFRHQFEGWQLVTPDEAGRVLRDAFP